MADGGVSAGYVNSQISSLRAELMNEIRSLKAWTASEIRRLEEEMREVGVMIVRAIDTQTDAVVGGVAANTVMIKGLTSKIEEEFGRTIDKLDAQIESALQVEYVKKAAEASSIRAKLGAFVKDIRERFDKSLLMSASNRDLYNLNFRKIVDEYQNKVRTIGDHIFKIRDEDIAPAIAAARVPYEMAHGLSIEMDLTRLAARSRNLDQTVELLRKSRVDEALSSLDDVERDLASFDAGCPVPAANIELCVEAVTIHSASGSSFYAGMDAQPVADGEAIKLGHVADLSAYASNEGHARVSDILAAAGRRTASAEEVKAIARAAADLAERKLISADAKEQITEFLFAGKLKMVEA